MPTAPRFRVTQDDAFVFVHVHVPYVRVSEMEFHVDGVRFSFYCKPYLLKLQFPHEVVDDELAKAVYDPNKENGTIVVHLPKKEPGLVFPDLDLLTKLLEPKKTPRVDLEAQSKRAPLIEVIHSANTNSDADDVLQSTEETPFEMGSDATLLELEKRFAEVKQAEEASYNIKLSDLKPRYGFNNAYSEVFRGWHGDTSEILSLPNPEETAPEDRRRLREHGEDLHFDVERYLLDYANASEDEYLAMAVQYVPHWRKYPILKHLAKPMNPLILEVGDSHRIPARSVVGLTGEVERLSLESHEGEASTMPVLTDADRELLARLPNKEFLISRGSKEEKAVMGGLLDILIGYVYEQLTTQGDSGVESTWTISILSPTLSWLDTSADVPFVIRSGVRRMITYPLLRQYELAIRVIRETGELLQRGKRVVLHCLLDIFRIVEKSETQYLLNSIYIQDYCIWIQSISDEQLLSFAEEVFTNLRAFAKRSTGWELEELENHLLDNASGRESEESESDSSSDVSDSSSSSSDEEEAHDVA